MANSDLREMSPENFLKDLIRLDKAERAAKARGDVARARQIQSRRRKLAERKVVKR